MVSSTPKQLPEQRWLRHVCAALCLPLAYHIRWTAHCSAKYTPPIVHAVAAALSLLAVIITHAVATTLIERIWHSATNVDGREWQRCAESAMAQQDWTSAAEAWTTVLVLNPKSATAFKERGRCYIKLHDKQRACADFATRLKINPDDSTLQVF
ncbi:hypothetical protein ACHHYP_20399 [Achlya hypogyna]|uniref:Uncharacterized protein n=1 Tax=Achlya hypogyna TaxID=1202772 RepID=A0A1V9YNP5_ACHHY|nr:hypothetical protein ACHHYP_20399 [Achlya hypogyna]